MTPLKRSPSYLCHFWSDPRVVIIRKFYCISVYHITTVHGFLYWNIERKNCCVSDKDNKWILKIIWCWLNFMLLNHDILDSVHVFRYSLTNRILMKLWLFVLMFITLHLPVKCPFQISSLFCLFIKYSHFECLVCRL